jgi:hypothetical protein
MWRLAACAALALCAGCAKWELFSDDTRTFFTRPMPDGAWATPAAPQAPTPEASAPKAQTP